MCVLKPDAKSDAGKNEALESSSPPQIRLQAAGEALVSYEEGLEKPADEKRIHPRRPLPLVPESRPEDRGETQ